MRQVYFLHADGPSGDMIKIGCSTAPSSRARQLSYKLQSDVAVIISVPGGFDEERELHALFAGDRLKGEWFRPSEKLLSCIDQVIENRALPELNDRTGLIARLYHAGTPMREIAAKLGISHQRVHQILQNNRIPSRGYPAPARKRVAA